MDQDTENLLKIQTFIDENKNNISDGEYMNMVNSLAKVWKFKNENEDELQNLNMYKSAFIQTYENLIFVIEQCKTLAGTVNVLKHDIKILSRLVPYNDNRCGYIYVRGKFKGRKCMACTDDGKLYCKKHI